MKIVHEVIIDYEEYKSVLCQLHDLAIHIDQFLDDSYAKSESLRRIEEIRNILIHKDKENKSETC